MSCHTWGRTYEMPHVGRTHVMSHLGEEIWNTTRRENTCHVTLRGGINEMS